MTVPLLCLYIYIYIYIYKKEGKKEYDDVPKKLK